MHPCACCATRAPGVGKLVVASRNKPHGALAVAAPIIFLALMLAGWWLSTTLTGIEAWRLPTPQSVVAKGRLVLALPMTWERVRITGAEAIAGCLLGSAVALPSAYAIYRSRLLAAAVEPFLGATQALPAIAIAPSWSCGSAMALSPSSFCAPSWCFPDPRFHGGWPASY